MVWQARASGMKETPWAKISSSVKQNCLVCPVFLCERKMKSFLHVCVCVVKARENTELVEGQSRALPFHCNGATVSLFLSGFIRIG